MPRLSDTIGQLAALRGMGQARAATAMDRLRDLDDFGANPGNLRARVHVPDRVADRPALVVVLHGCTQTAAGYDSGSGWSRLADEAGFVLLFPEQQRSNNGNLCFNWFEADDIGRGRGEVASIRAMIAAVSVAHRIDPAKVFVTGLSAGGAMAAAMLATYPELFAGGAVIGGLPYGTAIGVMQAMERMRGAAMPGDAALGGLVRGAATPGVEVRGAAVPDGRRPTLSVWHGGADATVHPDNAEAILAQWRALHGVPAAPASQAEGAGYRHRVWRDAAGRAVIEDHRIAAMGHGTPIGTSGLEEGGTAGAFMLDVGISSTRRIAGFWGIAPVMAAVATTGSASAAAASRPRPQPAAAPGDVGAVIGDALRAAGLLR